MIAVLIAGAIAMLLSLFGTPMVIRYFRRKGFGQSVRVDEDFNPPHEAKEGTPTMGGTAFVSAAVIAFLVAHLTEAEVSRAGVLMLLVFVGMAAVGFTDDFIKVRLRRSLGLSKTAKFLGQALIALAVTLLGPSWAGVPQSISLVGSVSFDVPVWVFGIWVFLMISGFSNAVNLTDGLDGLAAGSATLTFGGFTLIGFWMFRNGASYTFIEPGAALDVAVISAAGLAACAGFLWFNAPPAKIFMGDTGSLALGGLFSAMAIVTGTQLLLVVLGGLYVLETASVVAQVVAYRVFGRRILRMAPIHHHFELLGWAETTVVVRFWIISGLGITTALGMFYAEWFSRIGISQ
ncbi:phospho-N-acetylmuramoyl-pentapeptide-transferase [Salsipaludibacter albus]|uniref:phospho-N-acetylmuramoyl-pentapeptide- transferase n=1 Tax=Salsipaludibacter albus TaxID=2849650 RepID=UPI001EE3C9DA|nr:phospho-N-acetylmuramoyl-pentapeptide-transferase [Salsipaludibacter albus]MBY5163218.1 phospho-N-acetylmuramoyl-pentapeptide-transferase [Salsipaludibacter albus]